MADLVRALGEAGSGIKLICEGIATAITALGEQLANNMAVVGDIIISMLGPILDFIDGILEKVFDLSATIAHEIGETIRTVIQTTGDVIIGIIEALINAIPKLLNAVLKFVQKIGPAIDSSVDSILNSIKKLINFMVSGIEYMMNLVVDGMNGIISAVNSVSQYVGISIPRVGKVSIERFTPQYKTGTNYVPNDGLAYLHQGEAVIPKKYNNRPYQPTELSSEEQTYMKQMIATMTSLDNTMKQGIPVNGKFVQKGSDLVAVVNRVDNKQNNKILNNKVYAR